MWKNKSAKNGLQSVCETEDTVPAKDGLLSCSNWLPFMQKGLQTTLEGVAKFLKLFKETGKA